MAQSTAALLDALGGVEQDEPMIENEQPIRVGLALSGGGAKGLVHVGVIQVLEELGLQVDGIAGTSMGAIVGSLYASGYTGSRLDSLTMALDWDQMFSDAPSRRYLSMESRRNDGRFVAQLPLRGLQVSLPGGFINGQRVQLLLRELLWPVLGVRDFSELPIPFVAVASDIETGDAVPLSEGYLPDAIRASMAIPSVFTPVEIDGQLLVDGLVGRNLPSQDARQLGMDYLVCVDVSEPLATRDQLQSLTEILNQTLSYGLWKSIQAERELCDVLLVPDAIEMYEALDFDAAADLVELGRQTALAQREQLEWLATMGRGVPPMAPPALGLQDSVRIDFIQFEGMNKFPASVLSGQLGFQTPLWVTAERMTREIDRLYSSRYFRSIDYRIEPIDDGNQLIIRVREQDEGEVGFGFRYDQRQDAAFLVNGRIRNLVTPGSISSLEIQLGERFGVNGEFFLPLSLRRSFGVLGQLAYRNYSDFVFEDGDEIAQIRVRSAWAEGTIGNYLDNWGFYGGGVRIEHAEISPVVAPDTFQDEDPTLILPLGRFWIDSYQSVMFPRKGQFLFVEVAGTHRAIGSTQSMFQHRLISRGTYPLGQRWAVHHDAELVISAGDVPFSRRRALGGLDQPLFETGRFIGLKRNEAAGRHVQKVGGGLQFEFMPGRYVILQGNVGSAQDQWRTLPSQDDVVWGVGASLGLSTPIGPVSATLATGNTHSSIVHISAGYRF